MNKELSYHSNRIFYPDFIRVTALLCILLYHFQTEAVNRTAFFQGIPFITSGIHKLSIGHIGVSLFFILSGASLMISTNPFHAGFFLKKRWISLFPAYYTVWICAFAGTVLFMPHKLDNIPFWTILLTFFGLDGYVYSICPNFYMAGEWFFGCLLLIYILYPLLRIGIENIPHILLPVILFLWFVLMGTVSTPLQPQHVFYFRLPEFLFGMYLMKYWNRHIHLQGIIGFFIFLLFLMMPPMSGNYQVFRIAGSGIGIFMTLRAFAEWINSFILPKLKRIISFLAEISYEIFLLHHFILMLILQIFFSNCHLSQGAGFLLLITWCVLIGFMAWILHLLIHLLFHKKLK